jgi:transposase
VTRAWIPFQPGHATHGGHDTCVVTIQHGGHHHHAVIDRGCCQPCAAAGAAPDPDHRGLSPWQTVYHYWRQWRQEGVEQRILAALRERGWAVIPRPVAPRQRLPFPLGSDGSATSRGAQLRRRPAPLVVEPSFAWLERRRLSKDYEYLRVNSENAIAFS